MRYSDDSKKGRISTTRMRSSKCLFMGSVAILVCGLMYLTMFTNISGGLRAVPEVAKVAFDPETLHFLDHVIVVCGHSVLNVGSDLNPGALWRDRAWALLDYQRDRGYAKEIMKHIKKGVEEVAESPTSLLVFSGGQTRAQVPMSEAFSYWYAAEIHGWWGFPEVRERAVVEEFARDSYENLLFSIARFREVTGSYPTAFSVISFAFKEERFEHEHAPALRIPEPQFRYIGVQVNSPNEFGLTEASHAESNLARVPFKTDPYGCNDEINSSKRSARDPFLRHLPYKSTCPEIRPLLEWCGPELYNDALPWWNNGRAV